MSLLKTLIKICLILILLLMIIVISCAIYIQATKPAVPSFEQVKSDFSIIYQTKEGFEWISLEEISPEALTFFSSGEQNRPSSYWLQTIDSSFCNLPSAAIYPHGTRRSEREILAWMLVGKFKIYYDLPIETGTPARPITKLLHACTLSTDLLHLWSEQQLIEAGINLSYYGFDHYGIHAASLSYFDKSVRQLSLHETVILIGIPQSPSSYSQNKEDLFRRSCRVLTRLPIPEQEKNCELLKPYIDDMFSNRIPMLQQQRQAS